VAAANTPTAVTMPAMVRRFPPERESTARL
jgi:hypothetical protein